MRNLTCFIWIILMALFSCQEIPTDLDLDDLEDRSDYTGGMVVNSESYHGTKVVHIKVNGSESDNSGILHLSSAGYYRIELFLKGRDQSLPEVIRIVILDPERGNPEWGLPPWTPVVAKTDKIGDQQVRLLYPAAAPPNMEIPLVVMVGEELTLSESNLDAEIGALKFRIKRGVGSIQLPPSGPGSSLKIDNRNFPVNVNTLDDPPDQLTGELTSNMHIPADSYIHISNDLTIPGGITLSIGSGSFITIAPGVNIHNNGFLFVYGTADAPVTVTCSDGNAYWGGIIGSEAGNHIEANHTIFCRSGYHTEGEYNYGHAHRQALFYSENGELLLDHCYMIDHVGQIFYPISSDLNLTNCLVQRAKTGGQLNQSELTMDRSVFTDFPDDSYIYRDEDNDGLYLDETNAVINNSIFMFAKDDGLDSGASGGGEVIINNCVFESNFHEGTALSSGHSAVKLHRITNSLFANCGQGLELGYSSPNHLVEVESCRFLGNGIGIRYGDCYDFPHHGSIHIAQSESLENTVYDVWNMNREHWTADTLQMTFDHVTVSTPNPMYPELIKDE